MNYALNSDFTFRKAERIVSQKIIDDLFSGTGSHSLVAFPIRAVYKTHPSPSTLHTSPSTILVSVPKRRFHHAVDRNRVKRQLREAYRHYKYLLTDRLPADQSLSIAFIWQSDAHFPSAVIDKRVQNLLKRIADRL